MERGPRCGRRQGVNIIVTVRLLFVAKKSDGVSPSHQASGLGPSAIEFAKTDAMRR